MWVYVSVYVFMNIPWNCQNVSSGVGASVLWMFRGIVKTWDRVRVWVYLCMCLWMFRGIFKTWEVFVERCVCEILFINLIISYVLLRNCFGGQVQNDMSIYFIFLQYFVKTMFNNINNIIYLTCYTVLSCNPDLS